MSEDANDALAAPSRLADMLAMLTHPFRTVQGLIEYALAWLYTRQWIAVLGFSPVLAILLTLIGLAIYGWSIDKNSLVTRYVRWCDAELSEDKVLTTNEVRNPQADELMKVQGVSQFGEVLLNRLLQLENSDTRSRYLVALQIGDRGRRGQARQVMRQLAPERYSGFAPAHAWLAIDRIMQGPIRDNASRLILLNDLEVAATWSGTGTKLREILASLLESEGRIGDAIKVLQATAENDAGAWVPLVEVATKHGRKQPASDASAKAKAIFSRKITEPSATVSDYVNLARLWVLEQMPDEAIKQVMLGLRRFPEDQNLKLVLSECYRVKFLMSVQETESGIQCDIASLDEALNADPTNPAVSEEVAKLMARGGNVSPTLKLAMEKQLADGKSTTMTHLMLATHWLKKSDFASAIPHLEVADRKSPNAPVVLNNLALALTRVSPNNAKIACEMIDRALKVSGPHAELLDSQGEIRMAAGDFVGAVESFESAIGLDGKRIGSRKRLIEAYQMAGMKDMISVQAQKIREIEAAEKRTPEPALPANQN